MNMQQVRNKYIIIINAVTLGRILLTNIAGEEWTVVVVDNMKADEKNKYSYIALNHGYLLNVFHFEESSYKVMGN